MNKLIPAMLAGAFGMMSGCSGTNVPAIPAADNTAINERDQHGGTKTPVSQNENEHDVKLTADIRKRVVETKLSVNAQNVKIITQSGRVTLRGPVGSIEEKRQVEEIATQVAGAGNVDSQLEVAAIR